MRAVVQRVSSASVCVHQGPARTIGRGLVVLLGVEAADGEEDTSWLASKLIRLRLFDGPDEALRALNLNDIQGDCLVVSQFTLFASTKKGTKPSYHRAADPEQAIPLYESFIAVLRDQVRGQVVTGEFGAHMDVSLTNDGPVTLILDTKNRE